MVWPKEIQKWKDFNHFKWHALHGSGKDERFLAPTCDVDIYIINFEGLEWLLGVTKTILDSGKTRIDIDLRRFRKFGFDLLVVDELSKFKETNTQRYKAMKQAINTFKRRWGLTGSPAAKSLEGLFGQFYVMDGGYTFGKYITHYRRAYFHPSFNGFGYELNPGAEQQIYDKAANLVLRIPADESKLPKLVINDIKVELPPAVRKIYDQLDHDMLTYVATHKIVAANSGVVTIKCRQIANGGIFVTPEVKALIRLPTNVREWVNLHDVKTDAIEDLLNELQGSPLLVAYDFSHDLDRLRKRFGKDVPYIGGGTTDKRTEQLITMWNKGELPLLLGQPQAIALGLNMQGACHHIALHSLTYDYEIYDQLIRRVRRDGNKASRVFVHRIIADDTVDLDIIASLQHKENSQKAFFNALMARVLAKKMVK